MRRTAIGPPTTDRKVAGDLCMVVGLSHILVFLLFCPLQGPTTDLPKLDCAEEEEEEN